MAFLTNVLDEARRLSGLIKPSVDKATNYVASRVPFTQQFNQSWQQPVQQATNFAKQQFQNWQQKPSNVLGSKIVSGLPFGTGQILPGFVQGMSYGYTGKYPPAKNSP
jgi:hypothetical protein